MTVLPFVSKDLCDSVASPVPCPNCHEGRLSIYTDATVTERYAPAVYTVNRERLPRRTRQLTIAACNGCETIFELRRGAFVRSEEIA